MHGDDFVRFHTTNDYLRWHRDHYIDLENYILSKDPTGSLGYSKYVPFPKWDPNTNVPVYFNGWTPTGSQFNNISTKCATPSSNDGCRLREDYQNTNPDFKFNQNTNFTWIGNTAVPLPAALRSTGALCATTRAFSYTDNFGVNIRDLFFRNISDYSDGTQIQYHNPGHIAFDQSPTNPSIMGTGFGTLINGVPPNRASSAYIFWLWHAWIDDMWWDWDANCRHTNNSSTITNAYDFANGITVSTGTTTTFGTSGAVTKVQGKIIVQPGATLIIENGAILEILDDYYTNQACGIDVQAGNNTTNGGKLIIRTGAIIRGITSLGSDVSGLVTAAQSTDRVGNTIYPDARVYYLCRWPGITVKGVPTENAFSQQHGSVVIDGTGGKVLIQRAKTAILSEGGGIIKCKDAEFRDCFTAVHIKPYLSSHDNNVNLSSFTRTEFLIKDQVTKYFTNDNMYMHYKHDFHEFKQVILEGVATIDFAGCTFKNEDPNIFSGSHNNDRGTGIEATHSKFSLHTDGTPSMNMEGCPEFNGTVLSSFEGLSFGILSKDNSPPLFSDIGLGFVVFTDNHDGISVDGGMMLRLFSNKFNYTSASAKFPANSHHHFVEVDGNENTLIVKNEMISDEGIATFISVNHTGIFKARIQANKLTNSHATKPNVNGIICNGTHTNTDVKCNNFKTDFTHALVFSNGAVKEQGDNAFGASNIFFTTVGPCALQPFQNIEGINITGRFIYRHPVNPKLSCTNEGPLPSDPFVIVAPSNPSNVSENHPFCLLNCDGFAVKIVGYNKTKEIKVYPNPTSGKLRLELPLETAMEQGTVQIFNVMGQLMLTTKYNTELDVSSIAPGNYYLAINIPKSGYTYHAQFIKQ